MKAERRGIAALALACLAACGGAGAAVAPSPSREGPTTPRPAPEDSDARQGAIDAFGRRAWDAMKAGDPGRLVFDDLVLRELLDSAAASRLSARRLSLAQRIGSTDDLPTLLDDAEYAGVCAQGARDEEEGGVLGLRAPGWTLERVLVIGTRPGGRRIAAWLEGLFVFTDAGFGALDLERVEEPRWEHSDLEIAPCDVAVRNDLPENAR
jgi:hypothetical protein